MKLFVALLVFSYSALAGEYAVLSSGARLYADRHEIDGSQVTLYSQHGSTQLDASRILRFEVEEQVASPDPPAPQAAAAASSPKPVEPRKLVENAALKYGLPPALVQAVVKAESAYRADAVSPKGAIGLMQLMPATARDLGADPKVAEQNVDAGTRYLRDLLVKYDGHAYRALAAYNAGPGAVEKYHGVPPYRETHDYILTVLRNWRKPQGPD